MPKIHIPGGFTSGPWRLCASNEGNGQCVYGANGYGIGKVWDFTERPENNTNARLIAIAPDMAARIAELEAALGQALANITEHRDELLRDFCTFGTMDRSTMDEDEAECVADLDRLIETITAALSGDQP